MFEKICNLLRKIESYGHEAYIVGGFVRDFYLNKSNDDIDICTSMKPNELKKLFPNIIENDFGSLVLKEDGLIFEITTFRKECKYKNNRFPTKIKYVKRLKTDLKRRDFTMNAICLNSNGNYIDLYNGRDDIKNKIIKMIGNPYKKIKEDSLRILRAIRFATILDFDLDEKLKLAIKRNGYLLEGLSAFRKKEELEKILLSDNFKKGISLILELNLSKYLGIENLDKLVFTDSIIGIWAQLGVSDKYEFTSNERKTINKIANLISIDRDIDDNILYNNGLDICLIVAEIKKIDKNSIIDKYNNLPIKSVKDIDINPNEIIKITNNNNLISQIYKDLEGLIINKKIKNTKEDIITYIKNKYCK